MITKIENAVLVCVLSKAWKIEKEGKSGITYPAIIYTDKKIINCKTDERIYNLFEKRELVNGTAVIEIQETNYNEKKGVNYVLREFAEKK